MHKARLYILVVQYQQTVVGATVNAVEVHTIMVRAYLLCLISTAIGQRTGDAANNRGSPRNQNLIAVAFRDSNLVFTVDCHSRKANQFGRATRLITIIARTAFAASQPQPEEAQRSSTCTPLEHLAPRQARLKNAGKKGVHLASAQRFITLAIIDNYQLIVLRLRHRFHPHQGVVVPIPNRMQIIDDNKCKTR